jgi:hypothetical protein
VVRDLPTAVKDAATSVTGSDQSHRSQGPSRGH